jgi:hypothetical protein
MRGRRSANYEESRLPARRAGRMKVMEPGAEVIAKHLFPEDEMNVFAIFDGASIPDLLGRLYNCELEHECLYRGELEPDIAEVAPYLVRLDQASPFTHWAIEKGWGNHWGIFALSRQGLRSLRQHFRTFLIVHDSNAKPLLFRYYDPRVLRTYLPTCNAGELAAIFGPVEKYLVEDEQMNRILSFRNNSGILQQLSDELRGN